MPAVPRPVRFATRLAAAATALLGLAGAVTAPAQAAPAATALWVAPTATGRDCTRAAPCTMDAARVLAAQRSEHGDVTVSVTGGEYRLDAPLRFGPADSGRGGHRITYRAADGARPVFTGATAVTGWTRQPGDKNVWAAPVPRGSGARELYVNGVRAVRDRGFGCPASQCETDRRGITGVDPALAGFADPARLQVVINARWRDFHCSVSAVEGTTVVVAQPCWDNANAPTQTGWQSASPRGSAYLGVDWFENARELLGTPGQFFVDSDEGRVYYVPRPGEDLVTARVELPKAERLLQLTGTLDDPVHDLAFEGLAFTGTNWLNPSSAEGYAGAQAGYYVGGHRTGEISGAGEDYTRTAAAVEVTAGARIGFTGTTFTHLGGAGVTLSGGTKDSVVENSAFTDISGGAVFVGDIQHAPADPRAKASGNVVRGNEITRIGQEFRDAVGIAGGYHNGLTIEGNSLSDLPYTGISVGWGWNFAGAGDTQRDILVRRNKISGFMRQLHDGGAIYTQAQSPGSRVEENDIEFADGVSANGIYCDERSGAYTVQRNVVRNATAKGINWFSSWASWSRHLIVQDNWTDQNEAKPHNGGASNVFQRNQVGLTDFPAAAREVTANAGAHRPPEDRRARFTAPAPGTLRGTQRIDVAAPPDTRSVQYTMDGVAFAEVTRHYADGIGKQPSWRTVTDAGWFAPGRHVLRADAITAQGVVSTSIAVVTERPPGKPGVTDLDGGWAFATAAALPAGALDGDAPAAVQSGFRDPALREVLVPDSYGAVREAWNSPDGGKVLYRRDLHHDGFGPATLTFDACSFACTYWVNGRKAGESVGGHLPVSLAVGSLLRQGSNVLAVVADNTAALVRSYGLNTNLYWNWGGLTQGARLTRTAPLAVTGITADGAADGSLTLRADTVNALGLPLPVFAAVTVTGPDGRTVLSRTAVFRAPANGGVSDPVRFSVPSPRLWSPEDPALYTVTISPPLGTALTTRTGFRTVTVRGADVVLNGTPVTNLRGFNRHADSPGLGRTQPDGFAREELKTMRDRGFTLMRPAHYPTTPGELAAADELGILVMEEVPVTQANAAQLASAKTRDYAKTMLRRQIDRDRGHASVVFWSVGNENATNTDAGAEYVRALVGYGKQLDPSRLFTHVTAWLTEDKAYGSDDFVASNQYAGWYYGKSEDIGRDMDAVQRAAGDKPIVLSEYGADAAAGLDLPGKGGEYYQAALIDTYNRLLERRPHTLGQMIWTSTEFALTPAGASGDTYAVPGYHTKGLISYDRTQRKLGWRVITSPVRLAPLAAIPVPGEVVVRIDSVDGRASSGTLRLDGDDRLRADPVAFSVPAGGSATLALRVRRDPGGHTPGRAMVRAVVDDQTEALPQPLDVRG
ncbi:glycoside hydrolase family 2 TIM barrel-domain containing protein [Amycolatopsis minnesotensis]